MNNKNVLFGATISILVSFFSFSSALASKGYYYENNSSADRLHVLKLDNSGSTGNFVVLESNGKFALLDAGAVKLAESETVVYPQLEKLGIKEFEFIFVSHFDEDHFSYLTNGSYGATRYTKGKNGTLLDRYKTKRVITRDTTNDYTGYAREDYTKLKNSLAKQNIPVEWVDGLTFGDFKLTMVNNHPNSEKEIEHMKKNAPGGLANLDSVGVVVEKNGYKVFVGGDIERFDEADMIESGEIDTIGDIDVFVMNHHGISKTSNSEAFLDAIKAEVYIVTGGEERYRNENDAFHEKGTAKQHIDLYASKVGGEENILFNNNGMISVDFTRTSNGINVSQNLTKNYSKTFKRDIDVRYDSNKDVNKIYFDAVDNKLSGDVNNSDKVHKGGVTDYISAPNTGLDSNLRIVPLIVASTSLLILLSILYINNRF